MMKGNDTINRKPDIFSDEILPYRAFVCPLHGMTEYRLVETDGRRATYQCNADKCIFTKTV